MRYDDWKAVYIDKTKTIQHAARARKILGNKLVGVSLSGGNIHDSEMAIKLLSSCR